MIKLNKRLRAIFFYIISSFILLFLIAIAYFLFMESGSSFLSLRAMQTMNNESKIVWQKSEGTLIRGMTYKDIVVEDLKWFPVPNKLRIQSLAIDIDSFSLNGVTLKIVNGRLSLPDSEPVVFSGNIEHGLLDFNFYTKAISGREIENFVEAKKLQGMTANLADVDISVKGLIQEPLFIGEFVIENVGKNGFSLEQAPCVFEISLKNAGDAYVLHGFLVCSKGALKGKKTALIQLQESKIIFDGNPENPILNIKAASVVEKIKINIVLKGTFKEPDLQLNSDPFMSKDRLLLALATNKTWQNSEELLNKGILSPDLARDFIDYLLFGDQKNKLAEKLGLKSLSMKYDAGGKGIAVTKDLSDRLEGRYEVEEKNKNDSQSGITQKIGGEYKVTEAISFEANKELKQKNDNIQQEVNEAREKSDDQVLLKYKKAF